MSRLWLVMGWWGSRRTHLCRLPDGDLLSFSYPPRNPGGDRRLTVAAAAQAAPSTIVPHARKLAISSGAPSAVPALRCVFVHGIGVKGSSEPSSTPSPSGYWGAALEASCVTVGVVVGARVGVTLFSSCYMVGRLASACHSFTYLHMDTATQGWDNPSLATAFCDGVCWDARCSPAGRFPSYPLPSPFRQPTWAT